MGTLPYQVSYPPKKQNKTYNSDREILSKSTKLTRILEEEEKENFLEISWFYKIISYFNQIVIWTRNCEQNLQLKKNHNLTHQKSAESVERVVFHWSKVEIFVGDAVEL